MTKLHLKGYAVRIFLEASLVHGDKADDARYYRLEAATDASARECVFSTVERTYETDFGVRGIDTVETLSSEQGATITFNGGAEVAREVIKRARPMDRLRIEITNGSGWKLAFDGFLSAMAKRMMSAPEQYGNDITINAGGLWKLLAQSWWNWQGVIQPGYDVSLTDAGKNLNEWLSRHHKLPAEQIIRAFIEAGLSMIELSTAEGKIQPERGGKYGFFQWGSGNDWKSAFSLAYPMPYNTLPSWRGPLVGMIQMMAQPDIHECFCTYRDDGVVERPTIIFRPRPFPGKPGDDDGWKALTVHKLENEPSAKTVMAMRNDGQHPNAFHCGSSSDSGLKDLEQKILRGTVVDMRSLKRYGYASRPVASTLPPLSQVHKDDRGQFIDDILEVMTRIAYQEAPLPEMWTRTIQLPLRPGLHPGDVLEEYSEGVPWTGYISTVRHSFAADPWRGSTTVGVVRSLQCTAEEYPDKVRELVAIEFKPYVVPSIAGAADQNMVRTAICHPVNPAVASQQPVANVPWGRAFMDAAAARGVPAWALAHMGHIESRFGAVSAPQALGFMQFLPGTANDLNNQGYDKPFSAAIAARDPERSIDAAAWYLAQQRKTVDRFCPATLSDDERWAWAVYGYNQGLGVDASRPISSGWQFSPADKALTEYRIYWGPGAMQQAKATFGGLK